MCWGRHIAILPLAASLLGLAPVGVRAETTNDPVGDAPVVFYRTVGDGRDRLYRRVLDGMHLPDLIAERPAPLGAEERSGTWAVSPDGSVILYAARMFDEGGDPYRALERIDGTSGELIWRLAGRGLHERMAWSADGRWISDGVSLTDVATGATQDLRPPDDWSFVGFTADGSEPSYVSSLETGGTPARWRLDPRAGDRIPVPWGSPAPVGGTWLMELSIPSSSRLEIDWDAEDGTRPVVLRDLATGTTTPVAGLPPHSQPMGFDPTGRTGLVKVASGRERGAPARHDVSIHAIRDGATAGLIWEGRGSPYVEPIISADGRYLLVQPHYRDAALLLVALDGSGSVSIPIPGDVTAVTPVRVIPNLAPPSARLDLQALPRPEPSDAVTGSPSLAVVSIEEGPEGPTGRLRGRVRLVRPAVGGGVVTVDETVIALPKGDTADTANVTVVPRPGHRELLLFAGSWEHPRVYRWVPGGRAQRVRLPTRSAAMWTPIWSPDGRQLAIRVGGSGRRYAILDGSLRFVRMLTLPRPWTNATLIGWTADGRRLVLDPPTFAYAGTDTVAMAAVVVAAASADQAEDADQEEHPLCENAMPMATMDARTGAFTPHRGSRELRIRVGPDARARAATGEWVTAVGWGYAFTFDHGCPVRTVRSETALPSGYLLRDTTWSRDGRTLLVLAARRDEAPTRLLRYDRPWTAPRQRPRSLTMDDQVLWMGTVAPGAGWAVAQGESNLGGGSVGLLDLRSGAVHWVDGLVDASAWVPTRP